ncbi:MAG: ABC transporter substrate-binding protein [Armatimonadetes bacterium]|nr:ABC transporter substrate-binding protein [Armatimonadota bacterium]
MARYASLFLALLAVVLAGCENVQTAGGVPNQKPALNVISLSPSTTEIAMANYEVGLKGVTASCDYPNTVKTLPVVGDVKPNYEKIAEIKPDLIVYDASLYSQQDIEKLKSTVPSSRLLPFEATTVDGLIDYLARYGSLTLGETIMSEYADKITSARNQAKAANIQPKPKVAVIMGGKSGDPMMVCGKKSFLANVLDDCHFEMLGPDSAKFEPISFEQIVTENPDVIVTPESRDVFLKDPRFAATTAVKKGLVFNADPGVLLRAGARVDKLYTAMSAVALEASSKLSGQ